MIKIISILFFLFLSNIHSMATIVDIDYIRNHYEKAVTDRDLCLKMIKDLEAVKKNPLFRAYLGGLQTVRANFAFSPISKLNTFKEGKKNIDIAISQDPNNPELRFIRLSVQKNAPSFLGYSSMIEKDTDFIRRHQHEIKSEVVLRNLRKLLQK